MIKKLIWIATIFWLALIFYFSSQTAKSSRETSGLLLAKANVIQEDLVATTTDSTVLKLQHIIRKWAHFIIYFVMGALVTLSIITIKYSYYKSYLLAWLFSTFYALTDEIHQYFVPGRGALVSDVLLDSFSSLVAVFGVLIAVETLRYRGSKLLYYLGVQY